jgi:hypothetical protein
MRQETTMTDLPLHVIKGLLEQVARTHEDEPDCEKVDEVMDIVAEAAARGEDISRLTPLVLKHFEMCKSCREEFEALLRILQAEEPPPKA